MAKNNWILIKADYIQKGLSYDNLAIKYGISKGTIAHKGSEENWVEAKKKFDIEVQQKVTENGVDEVANLNRDRLRAGKYMVSNGVKALQKIIEEGKGILDPRTAKEMIQVGFELQTKALGLDIPQNQVVFDLKSIIMNINLPEEEVEQFIKWRNDKQRHELEQSAG